MARTVKRTAKKKSKAAAKATAKKAAKPKKVSWLAAGYPVLSAVTVLERCADAIDWYKKVLGAKQRLRFDMPGGAVAHCELQFGDSLVMMGTPMPPQFPPKKACLSLYVKNCDATYQNALANGARSMQEPADQFYGDRNGRFEDPFGNEWAVMTHIREVSVREMKEAMKKMGG